MPRNERVPEVTLRHAPEKRKDDVMQNHNILPASGAAPKILPGGSVARVDAYYAAQAAHDSHR
jgi:hypothetical protein